MSFPNQGGGGNGGGGGGGGGSVTQGTVPWVTDGSAHTQPISAASAIPVDGSGVTQPVSVAGTVAVNGSGVTQPVSAAALPLPAGASTSAKQAGGTVGNAVGTVADQVGISDGTNLQTLRAGNIIGSTTATFNGVATSFTIYTPPASHKFRLFMVQLTLSGDINITSGAHVQFQINDAALVSIVNFAVWIPSAAGTALGGYVTPWIDLGAIGYLSQTANNSIILKPSGTIVSGIGTVNYVVGTD